MKKTMLTLGTLILMATTANATFVPRKPHEPLENIYAECAVVRVTPRDHDRNPGYKVNVSVTYDQGGLSGIDVVHTLADGQQFDRSQQYGRSVRLGQNGYKTTWSAFRRGKKMVGVFDSYSMTYSEFITRDGRLETQIDTRCHDLGEGD